jgi:hemerythrin-like domain-containing protein
MERKPTDMLEGEHRLIHKTVGAMAVLAENLAAGRPVDPDTLRMIVDFMRTYADKCHHGKEEVHLFTLLQAKGVPARGCPLGALLGEHQDGRAQVTRLAEVTEAYAMAAPSAREELVQILHGLMELYPSHIWKEDYLLFPMANGKVLSAEDQAALYERFEAADEAMGGDVQLRFEQVAAELEKRAYAS